MTLGAFVDLLVFVTWIVALCVALYVVGVIGLRLLIRGLRRRNTRREIARIDKAFADELTRHIATTEWKRR